jgi:DNA-binding transcriptional ArsR family regulator
MEHFPQWFGKTPMMVSADLSISSDAVRVFGILSAKIYKNGSRTVSVTTRGISVLLKKSPQTIMRWLKQLENAGHIEKISGRNVRSTYRLLSPAFSYRVIVETSPNSSREVASEKLAILRDKKRKCPKCKQVRRVVSSSGVCEDCLSAWAARKA